MSEKFIINRVSFKKSGVQRSFISKAKESLGMSWSDFSKNIGINRRTLTDWQREKFRISRQALLEISKISKISIPSQYRIIDMRDHLRKSGIKGGNALLKKQGRVCLNEDKRLQRWGRWWDTKGRRNKKIKELQRAREIIYPKFNKDLAEFMGIMLGDGGVAKYYIAVTLNSETEVEYSLFVSKLLDKLFGVKPRIYQNKNSNALNVVVQRKKVVEFCNRIGLPVGSKIRSEKKKNFSGRPI